MGPYAVIVELLLRIVLEAMQGQTPEQKKKMWDWYIADVERWRRFFKIDEPPSGSVSDQGSGNSELPDFRAAAQDVVVIDIDGEQMAKALMPKLHKQVKRYKLSAK